MNNRNLMEIRERVCLVGQSAEFLGSVRESPAMIVAQVSELLWLLEDGLRDEINKGM